MERENSSFDFTLFLATFILLFIGLLMVYSASAIVAEQRYFDHAYFFKRQVIWAILGLIALFTFIKVDYHFWQKNSRWFLLIVILLLIAVLFFGRTVGGARRWLRFSGFGFQPSELAKLAVIIFLADYFDRKSSRTNSFRRGLLAPFLLLATVCFLIILEPDFGTTVFIALISVMLFFLAGVKLRFLLIPVFLGLVSAGVFVYQSSNRLMRVLSFFSSLIDLDKASYQTQQALYALGTGGFKGVGLGRGNLKLLYLPEVHTDFIFPILGEELGLLGTFLVILLFLIFAWRGWRISLRADTFFAHLTAAGITFLIAFQALINIGVSCGCLPTKGLPLPFISFGGSSLFCELMAVGILLNISRQKKIPFHRQGF